MRTPNTFLKMNNGLVLAFMLTLVFSLFSCEKDPVIDEPEEVSNKTELIDEIINSNHYYTEDSIKNIVFYENVIFGTDTLKFSLLNNLGIGRYTDGYDKLSILKITQVEHKLEPIVKYKIDEVFRKKIIVSWSRQRNERIVDSITNHEPNYSLLNDNSTSIGWELPFDSSIYIDVFVLNKFGTAELDIENPIMNDFLQYKSSKYNGLEKDLITITPQQFGEAFGTVYRSSMTLGNLAHFIMSIRKIDYRSNKKYGVLNEALVLIKKAISENISWDILKQNSTYFKQSIVSGVLIRSYGRSGSAFPDDIKDVNEIFDFYKTAHFGILGSEYKPYNTIYPKYNFLK
jgi:hypothetical protein